MQVTKCRHKKGRGRERTDVTAGGMLYNAFMHGQAVTAAKGANP